MRRCGCGPGCCSTSSIDPVTADLYDASEAAEVPQAAFLASLGCGNPTALAQLAEGETVLDLGSGGGIDVLLSARRVGPTGFAYGLDMTDEMLALAEKNKAAAGATNVEFLKGQIEDIPLPDNTVDVVISNCVINLSTDKPAVLREAFRVLRPGGRFAVADVVVQGQAFGPRTQEALALWAGCVAGALLAKDAGMEFPLLFRDSGAGSVTFSLTADGIWDYRLFGYNVASGGSGQGFVWMTPVPAPGSAALLAAGGLAAVRRRRS